MRIPTLILTGAIAALHLYFAWFEIFAWETKGPEIFSTFPADIFEPTVAMAANQGIYNVFLAAGLIWALFIQDRRWQTNIAACFLIFVTVAGIFGAATISTKVLFVQAVPAIITLVLWVLVSRKNAAV